MRDLAELLCTTEVGDEALQIKPELTMKTFKTPSNGKGLSDKALEVDSFTDHSTKFKRWLKEIMLTSKETK